MAIESIKLKPAVTTPTNREPVSANKESEVKETLLPIAVDTWESVLKMSETKSGATDNKIWPDCGDRLGKKTSPADIGLATAAAVAIRDLGKTTGKECEDYIDASLTFLEKVDRCDQGLFYNWYDPDTYQIAQVDRQTGMPLPAINPAVDNSILAVSLMVLRRASIHAPRAQAILSSMNFPYLYDADENLFRGVANDNGKQFSEYYLDMLLSESRLTTYVGINEFPESIPPENFRRLGRSCYAPKNGACTDYLVNTNGNFWKSWGGTFFEVTLPTIYVPEMLWGPDSFAKQYKHHLDAAIYHGQKTGLGIWTDPCDDTTGIFTNYGSPELGLNGYGQNGIEAPSAMFSCLSIAPEVAYAAIRRTFSAYPLSYQQGYGFRDSININNKNAVTPTCYSFNQARIILHTFNAIDPDGGVYKYTAPQLEKIRDLIKEEPPAEIIL